MRGIYGSWVLVCALACGGERVVLEATVPGDAAGGDALWEFPDNGAIGAETADFEAPDAVISHDLIDSKDVSEPEEATDFADAAEPPDAAAPDDAGEPLDTAEALEVTEPVELVEPPDTPDPPDVPDPLDTPEPPDIAAPPDTGPPPCLSPGGGAGCLVSSSCYASGADNPSNACETCSPGASTSAFTPKPGLPSVASAPPGTAARRFDVATMNCSACGEVCPTDDEKCLCSDEFQGLNYPNSPHFLALGTEKYRPVAWAQGNFAAVYIDSFIEGYDAGLTGAQHADAIHATAVTNFPSALPSWFIVNEISAGLWPTSAAYRDYVVAFAARLDAKGQKVVILAPFDAPGNVWAQWKSLAAVAYVGAESYEATTGEKVNASGNSLAYCKAAYQATIDAYANVGVPLDRLFLVEHFGQSIKGTKWGRAGVSEAGWKNAITVRSQAAAALGFAGFVSYGWAQNTLAATSSERVEFENTYSSVLLP